MATWDGYYASHTVDLYSSESSQPDGSGMYAPSTVGRQTDVVQRVWTSLAWWMICNPHRALVPTIYSKRERWRVCSAAHTVCVQIRSFGRRRRMDVGRCKTITMDVSTRSRWSIVDGFYLTQTDEGRVSRQTLRRHHTNTRCMCDDACIS